MNKPLTEKDFEPQYAGLIGIDFIKEKVQSAKRLLKQKSEEEARKVSDYIDELRISAEKKEHLEWVLASFVYDIPDACFQIDDGKEAKE